MCDFKVGDEVVCVDAGPARPSDKVIEGRGHGVPLLVSSVYTISGFGFWPGDDITPVIFLAEVQNDDDGEDCGFLPRRFRKVQRRNSRLTLEAFFTVPGGFEEPKRAPAKKRERV